MKKTLVLWFAVWIMLIGFSLGTPAQVEFVARIQTIESGSGGADLSLGLTPSQSIMVRVTAGTEIRDQSDLPISLDSLSPDTLVKVEGIFIEGGILALEIEITETPEEFEIRGEIEALTPDGSNFVLEILGFSILATPGTEIEDALGNRLFANELSVGQRVKVEANSLGADLVAREIKLLAEENGFARIRITGVVTLVGPDHILVSIVGGAAARVEISPTTSIQGNLVIGSTVEVFGSMTAQLSIAAGRISIAGLFRLLPDELHLLPNGTGRVQIVLNQPEAADLLFEISPEDPAAALATTPQVSVAAGALSAFFEVEAGAVEGRTRLRVSSPGLGNASRLLEVEVEDPGNDDNGSNPGDEPELEVKWEPRKLSGPSVGAVDVELRLNQPAPTDLDLQLFVKDGNPGLVSFPPVVHISAGQSRIPVRIEIRPGMGQVKIRAALPKGGDTDDLEIELLPGVQEQVNLQWKPADVKAKPGTMVAVELHLDRAAPLDFKVALTVKSGNPSLIQGLPSEIEFGKGQSKAAFQVQLGSTPGRVEFIAAAPFELGGDSEKIKFEIEN